MSCTPRGVGEPVARRDEHGASAATSERREDVSSIEWLGRLRRPPLNGPSRAPLSRRRRPNEEEFLWRGADTKTVLNGTARLRHLEF
jgi:hypothetical protein